MNRERAITVLRKYAACMVSENCKYCPEENHCSSWTEAQVLQALRALSEEMLCEETEKNGGGE